MTKAEQTYERIEALVASGKSKADAFRELAAEYEQSVDSVRGTYYTARRARGGTTTTRRKRRTETTADDAVNDAIHTLEAAIAAIQQEVNDAETRASEAARERDALVDAAGPKISAIEAKITVLREVSD